MTIKTLFYKVSFLVLIIFLGVHPIQSMEPKNQEEKQGAKRKYTTELDISRVEFSEEETSKEIKLQFETFGQSTPSQELSHLGNTLKPSKIIEETTLLMLKIADELYKLKLEEKR